MHNNLKKTTLFHVKLGYRENRPLQLNKVMPLQMTMVMKQRRLYSDLKKAVDKKSCRHHILMDDFNAKIGVKNINDNRECVGPFGIGSRNERGERLLISLDTN